MFVFIVSFFFFANEKYKFVDLDLMQIIVLASAALLIDYYLSKRAKQASENSDDEPDVFIDYAPLPKTPPTLPPTSEQIEFIEFMKKLEKEKEKELIRRE